MKHTKENIQGYITFLEEHHSDFESKLLAAEQVNVELKERLKNCLNHDSLLATRSELNKKDVTIKTLAEALSECGGLFWDEEGDKYLALAEQYK